LIVPNTSFFPQLVGTTYEYIWDIFCLNLEKASKTNREPFDRKIQLGKKDILCSQSSIDRKKFCTVSSSKSIIRSASKHSLPNLLGMYEAAYSWRKHADPTHDDTYQQLD